MNEKPERINGLAAHDRCRCRNGFICSHRSTYPRYLVMLILATCMLGAFIIHSTLKDIDVDDDDDMDGGMMIPTYNPT